MAERELDIKFKFSDVICDLLRTMFVKKQYKGTITFQQALTMVKELGLNHPDDGFIHLFQVHANLEKRVSITWPELQVAMKDLDCINGQIKLMKGNIDKNRDPRTGKISTRRAVDIMKYYIPRESHAELEKMTLDHCPLGAWKPASQAVYVKLIRPWDTPEDERDF
jgi:hypothetical protein